MAAYFLDSSALVKRYLWEVGSVWVRSLLHPASRHEIHLARITGAEVVSAISRRRRGGSLTPAGASLALAQFRQESAARFAFVPITVRLIDQAMNLADQHALRGYDSVQLAAALIVQRGRRRRSESPLTFVSADANLNAAAATEGLAVDDPNAHP